MFVCFSFSCECVYFYISHSKKKSVKYRYKRTQFFMRITRYSCQNLTELEFLSTDFRKILGYEVPWKSVQLEPSCCVGRAGRTDMTKLIVAFWNFAKAPKNNKGGRGMVWRNGNGIIDKKKAWQGLELCVSVVLHSHCCVPGHRLFYKTSHSSHPGSHIIRPSATTPRRISM